MEDQEMQRSTDRILTTHTGRSADAGRPARHAPRQGGRPALRRASLADAPDTRRGGGGAAAGGARARHPGRWRAVKDELHHLRERATVRHRDPPWGGGAPSATASATTSPITSRHTAAGVGRRQCYCIGPLQYTGQAAVQTDIATLQTAMVGVQA